MCIDKAIISCIQNDKESAIVSVEKQLNLIIICEWNQLYGHLKAFSPKSIILVEILNKMVKDVFV